MDLAGLVSYPSSHRVRVLESLSDARPSSRTSYSSPQLDFDEVLPAISASRRLSVELTGKPSGSSFGWSRWSQSHLRTRLKTDKIRPDRLDILTRVWGMGSSRRQLSSIARITPRDHKSAPKTLAGRQLNRRLRLTLTLSLLSLIHLLQAFFLVPHIPSSSKGT